MSSDYKDFLRLLYGCFQQMHHQMKHQQNINFKIRMFNKMS